MIRNALFTLLLAAGAAAAQPAPHGRDGAPPPPPGAPSPEALATVPGLTAAQQIEVRRILIQRRDAHDQLRAKEDAERESLATRYRGEHERIDDDAGARLRKLLGDDGYRSFATWLMPPRRGAIPQPGARRPRPPIADDDPAATEPAPDPTGSDAEVRAR